MSDDKLQKRSPMTAMEKGQYALAFVVVATLLVVAKFPIFVVFFFGIFAYFLWKIFSGVSRSETREVFEFYLAANEILRDDERKWYGFEIRDVVARGNRILQFMTAAPPLVHFALGALQNKIGDHKDAVANLTRALDGEQADELNFVFPSPELRNYVRVLRKIERDPTEAPMTSSAVRSLERARRIRGRSLLESSRQQVADAEQQSRPQIAGDKVAPESIIAAVYSNGNHVTEEAVPPQPVVSDEAPAPKREPQPPRRKRKDASDESRFNDRKPISEVLHDIYDSNTH